MAIEIKEELAGNICRCAIYEQIENQWKQMQKNHVNKL